MPLNSYCIWTLYTLYKMYIRSGIEPGTS